jgi:peptidoglycan/xylan/chitin deacetylase (PgdA/CDA1 family)
VKKENSSTLQRLKINALSNVVLGVLVLSIGALCLAPMDDTLQAGARDDSFRNGNSQNGVSLLINVYWGTEEVYKMLDVLQEYGAKATFFIGGSWADDNVDCLRAIFSDGHEIGNHGYFHKDHSKLSLLENQKEISACNRFIELAVGEKPTLFAPPSGAYNDAVFNACNALEMKTVLWSKDTIDWRDKDEKTIYKRATQGIKGGDFVLMHPMKETANVLDDILEYYKSQSLTAITVSENLKIVNEG